MSTYYWKLFLVSLNVWKFELQYEWTTPRQIFICEYCSLQLFCHNVEGARDIKCSQKQLELKFCWFQTLGSNFTWGINRRCSIKNVFLKIYNIHRKFCKIFKNALFTEHLWMTASTSHQLLALYLAIIYSWQLLSSEKSLVGKKFIHIFQWFYRFRFLLQRLFFIFFDKCLFILSVMQRVCFTLSSQPFCWLGDKCFWPILKI